MRASPRDQDDAAFSSWMKRLQVQEEPGHRFVILEIVHVLDGNEWYTSKRPSGPDTALYEACERVGEPRALREEELLTALRAVPRSLDWHISGLAMLMLRRLIRARRSWYIVLEEYRNTLKERHGAPPSRPHATAAAGPTCSRHWPASSWTRRRAPCATIRLSSTRSYDRCSASARSCSWPCSGPSGGGRAYRRP